MITLRYKGDVLDVKKGTVAEMQHNNPLFLEDGFLGEYSTPIELPDTENNRKHLGFLFDEYSDKTKFTDYVEAWENESFAFNAQLVIDKSILGRDALGVGSLNGILLNRSSNFFAVIREKKANTLRLGGTRTYNFTTFNRNDGSNGYYQVWHQSWNNTLDFLVAPIHNPNWFGDVELASAYGGFMNCLDDNGNITPGGTISLFPRVKYVMEEICREFGWTIDTTDLNGTGWDNLFLFSAKILEYQNFAIGGGIINISPLQIRLAQFLDPSLTVADVFTELCKAYGWIPLFDDAIKHCTLKALKFIDSCEVVDLTPYLGKTATVSFEKTKQVLVYANTLSGNDNGVSTSENDNYKEGTPVMKKSDLPALSAGSQQYDTIRIFVFSENRFYKVDLDPDNNRVWVAESDVLLTKENEDSNAIVIDTKVSSLPMSFTKYRTSGGTDYYAFFPYSEQSTHSGWGLRTLYYHGIVKEQTAEGAIGTADIPYLSSVRTNYNGAELGLFSNVPTHKNPTTQLDKGIVPYWFANYFLRRQSPEVIEEDIALPYHMANKINWFAIYLLRNKPYFLKQYIKTFPYSGFIRATFHKVVLGNAPVIVLPPSTSGVYLRIRWEDVQNDADLYLPDENGNMTILYATNVKKGKPIVRAFSDAACTIPLDPVALAFSFKAKFITPSGVGENVFPDSIPGMVLETTQHAYFLFFAYFPPPLPMPDPYDLNRYIQKEYTTVVGNELHRYDFELLPSADYTIVP